MHHANAEPWDRVLVPALALASVSILVVAGLDTRFRWSGNFTLAVKVPALILVLAGTALGTAALLENAYFSSVVRIQADRGHRVVSTGPYRWIRHPGYGGGLVVYLAIPVLLDAATAFVPALLLAVVLVTRTALEDRTLRERLAGYREYTCRVRYRLLPGIW